MVEVSRLTFDVRKLQGLVEFGEDRFNVRGFEGWQIEAASGINQHSNPPTFKHIVYCTALRNNPASNVKRETSNRQLITTSYDSGKHPPETPPTGYRNFGILL